MVKSLFDLHSKSKFSSKVEEFKNNIASQEKKPLFKFNNSSAPVILKPFFLTGNNAFKPIIPSVPSEEGKSSHDDQEKDDT